MLQFQKDDALRGVPFGVLEVTYPAKALWREDAFRTMTEEHLQALKERFTD